MSYSIFYRKKSIINLALIIATIYFLYHCLAGQRGLFSLIELRQEIQERSDILKKLNYKKRNLDNKVSLLSSNNLDLDYLDELAREKFALICQDEKLIVMKANAD